MKNLVKNTTDNKLNIVNIVFFTSLIITVLPIWFFEFPAMVDLPQHISQVKAFQALLDGNEFYSDIYKINWLTPYVIPNLILLVFSKLFTPIASVKISVSIYLIAIPIISRKLLDLYNRPKELQLLTIPLLYGVPFNWGFIPYLISTAIGVVWIYFFIKDNDNILSLKNIVISFLLAFSHAISWGVITFNILVIYLYRNKITYKNILKAFPIISPVIIIFAWSYLSISSDSSATELRAISYYPILYKILIMFVANFMGNDIFLGIPKIIILYFSIRLYTRIEKNKSLYWTLIISNIVLFYISPHMVFSTAYFSDRLLVLLPLFFVMIVKKVENKNLFIFLSTLCVLLSVGSRLTQQYIIENDFDNFSEITSKVQKNKKIFYISDKDDLGEYKYGLQNITYYIHIAQLLNNNIDVVVDFNFSYYHNIMIRYKNKGIFNSQVSYNYKDFNWKRISKTDHYYIIVRDCDIDKKTIHRIEKDSNHTLIAKNNCWSFYERNL